MRHFYQAPAPALKVKKEWISAKVWWVINWCWNIRRIEQSLLRNGYERAVIHKTYENENKNGEAKISEFWKLEKEAKKVKEEQERKTKRSKEKQRKKEEKKAEKKNEEKIKQNEMKNINKRK